MIFSKLFVCVKGLEQVVFGCIGQTTSTTLVSEGAECILINRKYFQQYLTDDATKIIRNTVRTCIEKYECSFCPSRKKRDIFLCKCRSLQCRFPKNMWNLCMKILNSVVFINTYSYQYVNESLCSAGQWAMVKVIFYFIALRRMSVSQMHLIYLYDLWCCVSLYGWWEGMVNFILPFMTNVSISISILQTFRSWVATSHLRPPMAFLSHNLSDTPGLAPLMNVLFWGRCDFPRSFSGRDMSRNIWNRL